MSTGNNPDDPTDPDLSGQEQKKSEAPLAPTEFADSSGSAGDAATEAAPATTPRGSLSTDSRANAIRVGTTIGPYRLVAEIGEGGMGQVFKAEQREPVQRSVALKLIKAGMDSKQVIGRFEAERQALALMDHPNIARVLDAGTAPSGHPYFVMELVGGSPINHFCDKHQLDPKARLRLFMQVCQAVQHAHQKGIIHRDIKPSNVLVAMVDGKPQAKVIDFGLAKATDQRTTEKSMFTSIGQFVGTPAYMSPEQADLSSVDIDTRTDVYSLGVLLYELLTGATPLDAESLRKAGYSEIQRLIREQEPPRMSTKLSSLAGDSSLAAQKRSTNTRSLSHWLRGDLDVIVMKALEKDRGRRYDSPTSFADDIRRFLNQEVIQARPASRSYRARRFVQRNKLMVTAAGLVSVSLILGTVVSLAQANRASKAETLAIQRLGKIQIEQRKTQQALSDTAVERDRALQAEQLAEKEAKTAKAINEFLKYDLLAEAAPSKNPRNKQITVEELVARAAESIDQKFTDEPVIQADLRNTIGETLAALGNLPDSEKQFAMSLEIMREHLGEEHPDTIMGINNLGLLQKFQGNYEQAEENYLRALALHRKVNGDLHQATLGTLNNIAMLYNAQGRLDEALPMFLESLNGSRITLGNEHPDTLQTMNNLAGLYRSMEKFDEAETLFTEALEIQRRVSGNDHPGTLATVSNLALWYMDQEQFDKAEELLQEAVESGSRVLGPEHYVTLIHKNNLGNVYKRSKRYQLAEELLSEVLESRRNVLGVEHGDTLGTMLTLANIFHETGDFAKAEALFRERIDVIEMNDGAGSLELSKALSSFGEVLLGEKRYESAIDILRRCLNVQQLADANTLQIADVRSLLGAALAGRASELLPDDPTKSQQFFTEAEPLLISGYEELAASEFGKSDAGKPTVQAAQQRVVDFYTLRAESGDSVKADQWRAK